FVALHSFPTRRSSDLVLRDLFGNPFLDATGDHRALQLLECGLELRELAMVSHRSAQLIRLACTVAAQRHGDRHGLLLEDRHAVGAAQDRLEQRMRVRDLLPAAASLRVRMDEARLHRAGPDERYRTTVS